MNFLKIKTSWSTSELALLKICLVTSGIAIGLYFQKTLEQHLLLFCGIGGITGIAMLLIWFSKLKYASIK